MYKLTNNIKTYLEQGAFNYIFNKSLKGKKVLKSRLQTSNSIFTNLVKLRNRYWLALQKGMRLHFHQALKDS